MRPIIQTIASSIILFACAAAVSSSAETILITAPQALPRSCPLIGYTPLVRINYSDLKSESYILKVWLLDGQKYNLASTQWSERTIPIENQKGAASEGQLRLNVPMDVFDYGSFIWVARLYDSSGAEVASAKAFSKSVAVQPVLLRAVGRRVGVVSQSLRISLATDAGKDAPVVFQMQDAPAKASLDPKTGIFTWTPEAPGVTTLVFEAVAGDTRVADDEIVTIVVSARDE